ncbi:MAG: hypothetical protein IT487_11120 [Chromatiaceae bacterium]|nr:hypothetical protein [Chromatiaceae bacterium]
MNSYHKGFISVAFGRQHAAMALDMALSLRDYHSEPISIAVDRSAKIYLDRYKPSPFDKIITLPQRVHPWGAKFLLAEVTPYEHNVFVDADILFLGPSPFFEYEFTAPLAMYGAYFSSEADIQTYYSTKQICADFGLKRYFWGTSGIFVFYKREVTNMFQACYEFYTSGIKKYPKYAHGTLADEMVFGIMSDRYPIDSIACPTIHPWPLAEAIGTASPTDCKWPVFHMFAPPSEECMNYLMERVNSRRRQAGFALTSVDAWRNKAYSIPSFWDKLKHVQQKIRRRLVLLYNKHITD